MKISFIFCSSVLPSDQDNYNLILKNQMNSKLTCSIANLTRRIIFNFSKDPFEKFNRKKPTPNQKVEQSEAGKQENIKAAQKMKASKAYKTVTSNFSAKTTKNDDVHSDKNQDKQEKLSASFSKFNARKLYNQPKKQEIRKGAQEEKKEAHHEFSEGERRKEEEQHQDKKEESIYKIEEQESKEEVRSSGFSKFQSRKNRQAKRTSLNPPKDNIQTEKQKKEKEKKKDTIHKITYDLEENDKSQSKDEDVVLRKPRGYLRNSQKKKQPVQPKEEIVSPIAEETQASKLNMNEQPEIKSEQPKMTEEQHKQYEKWIAFQTRIEHFKSTLKKSLLRYDRLNLIKEDPEQVKKEKEKENQAPQVVNHKKNFIKLIAIGVGLVLLSSNQYFDWDTATEVDPEYLKQALDENRIEQTWFHSTDVETNNEDNIKGRNIHKFVYIQDIHGNIFYCVSNPQFERLWMKMLDDHNNQMERKTPQIYQNSGGEIVSKTEYPIRKIMLSPTRQAKKSSVVSDARSVLSLILLYYFIRSIMDVSKGARGKGGKGATSLFDKEKSHRFREVIKVTFKDVVGMQKAKEEIVEFIDFLKFPAKYNKLGARIPKGALLTGPPGTGKTMIAKACAGESQVPFFTISGSEFIEMYVGVGAQRVRNLFKQAKQAAPSIIFIDEIDAVGKKRTGMGGGGNDQRDTTLNQLLVEMDGFDSNTNVIIFAATNQKEVLDAALTRPGRFDRLIEIDLPDLEGRREIFEVHLKPLVLDANINIKEYARRLATLTPGFSGADIKNVCNQAAIIAARNNKEFVSIMDFQLATERIIGGVEKKSQLITPETRKIVAYHECGHGVVSWFIKNANPLLKLTIIPRSKGALGFAQYLPNEHQMYTKDKLIDQICVILGGRISEEIFFNKISTGASDDLNKAYQIAKTLVTQYGFGDKLGWLQYDETEYAKEYSKDIENKIDAEIIEIMRICTDRTRKLINEKKDLIHNLAEKLLELETIDQLTITSVLGERPFKASKQHAEYIKEKQRQTEEILSYESKKSAEGEKVVEVGADKIQGKDNNTVSMKRSDYLI